MTESDELYMAMAIDLARAGAAAGEVPVGAVLVRENRVLATAHNRRESAADPTAHAEILVLREGAAALGAWRLTGATLYVTLEPCAMCAGAAVLARVDRIVFGCADARAGACGSVFDVVREPRLNHHPEVCGGLLAGRCQDLLLAFFAARRGVTIGRS